MKKFRIIALFIVISLIIVPFTSVAADITEEQYEALKQYILPEDLPQEEEEADAEAEVTAEPNMSMSAVNFLPSHIYTALGDSISCGQGGEVESGRYWVPFKWVNWSNDIGHVDMLKKNEFKVGPVWNPVNLNLDLSESGLDSAGLLASLVDMSDPMNPIPQPKMLAVAAADDITISIGGNDLLKVLKDRYEADPNFFAKLNFRGKIALTSELMKVTKNFGINWLKTMTAIRLSNEDANIYVNTLYNPFGMRDPLCYFAEPFIQLINASIRTYAELYNYTVIDVNKAFYRQTEFVHPLNPVLPYPLHPTPAGYETIYAMHQAVMFP